MPLMSTTNPVASLGNYAAGNKAVDWPRKCFNGMENWQLGWYQGRQTRLTVDEAGHLIKVASFVDFKRTNNNEPVTVRVGEIIYLQYNVAKEFNVDTEEKKNELTITAKSDSGSEGIAGLKENEQYVIPNYEHSGRNLVIEACRKLPGSLGADVMLVSVALDASLCSQIHPDEAFNLKEGAQVMQDELPTTNHPSVAPSAHPTDKPSGTPASKPTDMPTGTPTRAPTLAPTERPSSAPSTVPTDRPSKSPKVTSEPTQKPSEAPSRAPIRERTASPTAKPNMGSFRFWNLFHEIVDDKATKPPKINYTALLEERAKLMKGRDEGFDPDKLGLDEDDRQNRPPPQESTDTDVKPVFELVSP
jgi:hypothetical protein